MCDCIGIIILVVSCEVRFPFEKVSRSQTLYLIAIGSYKVQHTSLFS